MIYLPQRVCAQPASATAGGLISLNEVKSKDKVFPLSEGRKIQTYFDADLFVMDGVGHSAPFEDYGTFMMRFKSFLKE